MSVSNLTDLGFSRCQPFIHCMMRTSVPNEKPNRDLKTHASMDFVSAKDEKEVQLGLRKLR